MKATATMPLQLAQIAPTKMAIALLAASSLVSCSSSVSQWEKTQYQNTISAYQGFVGDNPDSEYVADALSRIDRLSFNQAKSKNDELSYQTYLERFPKGLNAPAAHNALEQLRFAKAKKTHNIASYQSYLGQYADGKYALQARNQIDQFSFKKAQDKQTTAAYKNYLQLFPEGIYADEARSTLRYLPLLEACMNQDEPRVNQLLDKGMTLAAGDVGARALLEILQSRMATVILMSNNGGMLSSSSLVGISDEKKIQLLDQFALLLKAGAEPNNMRIVNFKKGGNTALGGRAVLRSTGNPGSIVSADKGGLTALKFSKNYGLVEYQKLLEAAGAH
ncbi:MAG: hypothetical protein P1U80_09420 [Pseudomonadales bacterium]|nr:hypothetical protein [Pseudomonadales bacterium]